MSNSVTQSALTPPQMLTFSGFPSSGNLTISGASSPTVATVYNAAGAVLATLNFTKAFSVGPFAFSGGAPYVIANTPSAITLSA